MTDQADQPVAPSSRPGRGAHPLILLALLVVAIFAAWQVHEAFFDGHSTAPPRRAGARSDRPSDSPEGLSVADLLADPFAGEGTEKLNDDPGGIAPPAGAAVRLAQRVVRGNVLTERASYDVPGEVAETLAHYIEALARRGLGVLNVHEDRPDAKFIEFSGADGLTAVLYLWKLDGDDRMVRVILVVDRPESRGRGQPLIGADDG